ncbi:MAG: carbon starvation protein A [Planctomycetota bacterium]|nr:MAG: carbon starvation protein A [Planctomycetota bacterium]
MSSLVVAGTGIFLLFLGYVFYSRKVKDWIGLDDSQVTPAVEINDGVDYVPVKHWTILFGHHFASIAGAAPIIGPVIACLFWGWLPALVWIVVGGILFGAVHDFVALVLSLRHGGKSITTVTESVMGKTAKILFGTFALLALILVVAVFAAVAGKTLETTPEVVVPTFGLIFVALVVGILMYRVQLPVLLCSLIGVALLCGLIVAGYYLPVRLGVANPAKWWTVILLIYGMIASVTPVTLLLQPRDHLAGAVLYLGMFFGFFGLILTRPAMQAPAFISFATTKGWMWPMLLVTVACGALSGFHSLVSSGTTSKQVRRMSDARAIGYGAMILESALAVLAVVAVTAGLYWTSAPEGFEGLVFQDVFEKGGWIRAFGDGYGQLTKVFFGGLGVLLGVTMLKTFIMTTLDSATRITRYLCNELLGETLGIGPMKNKYVAVAFVGVCSGALALGNWRAIWPVFGAANQLVASLVLIVASVYLLMRKRNFVFTAVPAAIMLVTTIAALGYQVYNFSRAEEPNRLLAVVSVILICLALFLTYTALAAVAKLRKNDAVQEATDG